MAYCAVVQGRRVTLKATFGKQFILLKLQALKTKQGQPGVNPGSTRGQPGVKLHRPTVVEEVDTQLNVDGHLRSR